jgi:hypothetical protein
MGVGFRFSYIVARATDSGARVSVKLNPNLTWLGGRLIGQRVQCEFKRQVLREL